VLAEARNLRDSTGQMIYPLGFGAALGVTEVGVPELAADDVLALDSTRSFLIMRDDFTIETSSDFAYDRDAVAVRIKGRFAVAVPAVEKSLRRLVTTASGAGRAASGKRG
jgi:hypothetical protein